VNRAGQRSRLFQNVIGEPVRDVMRANQNLDINAEIVRPSQDLNHAPRRPLILIAEIQNLGCDDHAVQVFGGLDVDDARTNTVGACSGRRQRHTLRDLDPLPDSIVVRDHEVPAATYAKLAHHRRMRPFQHAQNLAVRTAVRLDASDLHHDPIAVHRARSGFLRDVNVALQPLDRHVRRRERESIAMHAQAADGELAARAGRNIMPRSCFDDFAARGQALQLRFNILARHALPGQLTQQLLQSRAPVRQLAYVGKDQARL